MFSTAAIRAIALVLAIALSGAIVASASAQPAGPGPGNSFNAKRCQQGGWLQLVTSQGASFADQEECVAYAAHGGVLAPKPVGTPREQFIAICESAGGTFTEGTYYWRCDSPNDLTWAGVTELGAPCEAGGRDTLWSPFGPPYLFVLCVDPPDDPGEPPFPM